MASFEFISSLNPDALKMMLQMLDAAAIITLTKCCSKKYRNVYFEDTLIQFILDDAWKQLCHKRWNTQILSNSDVTWEHLYRSHHINRKIPRGLYTDTHNISFGEGAKDGLLAWLFLSHTSNGRLRSQSADGRPASMYAAVYICIQNACGKSEVELQLNMIRLHAVSPDNKFKEIELKMSYPVIIARNGSRVESSPPASEQGSSPSIAALLPLNSICISFKVYPDDDEVLHEVDFLSMLRR
jgi:hypothetical protein